MRTREDIEQQEEQTLAPYATKSKGSRGRKHAEPSHDVRTCYQRDRDRIVHCEAFRKLEYKTQVFSVLEGDYYRTRLTHTIEVAQIGRTIGRSLRLNEDLIEAIALAHDLGHPPFGHAGEKALKRLMEKFGGFNHNRRSFDIVDHHEKRYVEFDGLNLSYEVRLGILKHDTAFDQPSHVKEFKGVYPTIEAQVVDFADSLAYLNHDVDDGLKSGCLSPGDLNDNPLWKRAIERVHPAVDINDQEMLRYQVVKQLIDMQVRDFLTATDENLDKLDFASAADVQKCAQRAVCFSPKMQEERNALQDLLTNKLYEHYRVIRMTSKAKRIIEDLFNAYLAEPQQLPYTVYPRDRKYSKEELHHIICDYLASMTDRFALDEHKKFFSPYTKV